ncbi:hypothetical protein BDZ94DRAFT_1306792 [Collybia nuda]|uniref:Uncharacterized protein n=1 Tax=Collybia nuda TaxID=64659 RepID=A0A9P6CMA0_9AGAR|nr:hypothetical protein BDZ94DRAFT_1306792 [Collybia nuda]
MNSLVKKSFVTTTFNISSLVLTTLRDTARVSYLSYLSEAATLALGILGIIQNAKKDSSALRAMCDLVSAIIEAHSQGTVPLASNFQQNAERLVITLTSIFDFAKLELSKNFIRRMIGHNSDRAKITEYREAIRQAIDVFGDVLEAGKSGWEEPQTGIGMNCKSDGMGWDVTTRLREAVQADPRCHAAVSIAYVQI